jgi:DNA mismatch repair protein MutL
VRVLPPDVANQIAAGEVVERPASVVKELIENSLDAGATRITIELEGAGCGLIAVVDDGEGMHPEDAAHAFGRHATSKLASIDELQNIATLGFRGEALASIAAVSQTTVVTRRAADLAATRVNVVWGTITDVREEGAPAGTRVEVVDLFGNTPARRKFLKAPATEVAHVSELVTRTALAWPRVGFVLRHAGRTLADLPPVEDDGERVRQVVGDERRRSMLPFASRGAAGYACGWLTDPHLTFPGPRHIYTYVNRRYIRDKLVQHALLAGYSTLLMHGRYPGAVVFIDVDPEEVDVNVHPAKSEVRFRRGGAVHELLSHAVQARLRDAGGERAAAAGTAWMQNPFATRPTSGAPLPPLRLVERTAAEAHTHGFPPQPSSAPFPMPAARLDAASAAGAGFFRSLRVLGQVFGGYLVCEGPREMVLIDQHAAHERVMFERLRAAYSKGAVSRQQLLVPAVVDVGDRAAALLAEHAGELGALGFDVESYGGTTFAVRALPALIGDADPATVLRDLADDLVEFGRSRRVAEAAEDVLARLACHSAVRLGQDLRAEQVQALLASMDEADFSGNCPHGRPAFVTFARGEIERWFKRT